MEFLNYLQTPDLLVDLISSSKWSNMMSLMNSYQARIEVISLKLPSRTFNLIKWIWFVDKDTKVVHLIHLTSSMYVIFRWIYLNTSCCIWNVSLDLKTFVPPPMVPSSPVSLEYSLKYRFIDVDITELLKMYCNIFYS